MSEMGIEVLLVVVLVALNGVFAMSEIAVVSARKARLQQRADAGDRRAGRALELAEDPIRFLSTVQIGITLVGILAGAFGGATITEEIGAWLESYPVVAPYSQGIGLAVVVLAITYLSLVVGELVPKRIGLNNPEGIASAVAGPMQRHSRIASPVVWLLTASTEGLLRLLGVRCSEEPPVSGAEISVLLEQGTRAGVFEEEEQEMVERVFWLGDQRVASLITPRYRVVWLEVDASLGENLERMMRHRHSRFPVCDGGLDRVLGMVEVKDLWAEQLQERPIDLRASLKQPLFVPESTRALRLLELFRDSGTHLAVVVDEYGGVQGIVTLDDVLDEVAGDAGAPNPHVVRREDGSWLVDGSYPVDELRDALGLPERREEERGEYRTVGGFVVTRLGRIPSAGDHFEADGLRMEVVDMDGNRVDKVLIVAAPAPVLDDASVRPS